MRCRSAGSTALASTTPSGLPNFPSASANTRSTVTSMAMRPMLRRCRTGAGSGGAALVGAHCIEHRDTGIDRSGDRALADAVAQQTAQQFLVVGGRFGRVDEPLHDLDEAVRIVVEREMSGALEDF